MDNELENFKITNSQTFIEFVELLRDDFFKNPDGWENKTIPDFLKAISSRTESVQGYQNSYQNRESAEADWKTFANIFKGAKENYTYPNPWNFNNTDRNLRSPNGLYKVEFSPLYEIAMGGPIGGECFLIINGKKLMLNDWCGGPIVWNTSGSKIALPVWTENREQRIAVADVEKMTITTYKKLFRVLDLRTFEENIIKGYDSPIHMTSTLYFDIEYEAIEDVKEIR